MAARDHENRYTIAAARDRYGRISDVTLTDLEFPLLATSRSPGVADRCPVMHRQPTLLRRGPLSMQFRPLYPQKLTLLASSLTAAFDP